VKRKLIKILALSAGLFGSAVVADETTAVSIRYGVVESAVTVEEDSQHAGGALLGGAMGALIGRHGPRSHTGLRVAAGAATGAAIQGATTGGTSQQYTVKMLSGGSTVISTEQTDIRQGDCVSIEQGDYDNIRRVGSVFCQPPEQPAPEHHQSAATNCNAAKKELSAADTDDEVDIAIRKVQVLCED
jgi:hypothetical protein